jgi:predicted DsbA family dithiol-disulfide isomerase
VARAIDHVTRAPLDPRRPLSFALLRVPFFLEPDYDESKPFVETNRDRLIKKWGGVRGWERQKQGHDLKGRGLEAGIPHFNLDRLAASSMASHRLIQHLGKTRGLHVSEAVYDLLNAYYFVDGHSLNDRPRLARAVADKLHEMGYDDDDAKYGAVLTFLNGREGRDEIERAIQALRQMGVHGIPKFIIEGTTVIDGAAQSEVFIEVFRTIEERGKVLGGPLFGEILGVPQTVIKQGSHSV